MNHPGEIARLTRICRPDVGLITNIGPAHLEGVGSIEGVRRAKQELVSNMPMEATAILNADDPMVQQIAAETKQPQLLFGTVAEANVRAEAIKQHGQYTDFRLVLPQASATIRLAIPGQFMVANALAAAAIGHHLGLTAETIKIGLEEFRPVQGRMNIVEGTSGIHIIDDTYNANPGSMQAAIQTLAQLKGEARGIVIIGDMLELGQHAEALHSRIGALVADTEITRLYVMGGHARTIIDGYLSAGGAAEAVFRGNRQEILNDLAQCLTKGDWVLVKGSRAMKMEKVVQHLRN
jgi:UDP-N-acetylmuramoyl-tripeptide--D-alanyl-D-alanine ligase